MTETLLIPKPHVKTRWLVGIYLLAPIGLAIGYIQQPDLDSAIAGAILAGWTIFYALLVWYARRQSSRLEGTTLIVRGVRTQAVNLATARKLRLAPDNTGNAVLTAKGAGGSVFLQVLRMNPYHTYAQRAEVCEALAAAVRSSPLPQAIPIASLLQGQADHLRSGGTPETSPLKPYTSTKLLKAAGAAGALGVLGSLDL